MTKLIILCCFFVNITYASSVKLVDYLFEESGVVEILSKYGIKGSDASQIKSYVATSIEGLSLRGGVATKADLMNTLSKLPMIGEDAALREQLKTLLNTSEDQMSKENLVKAIDNLIYLSNRHGRPGAAILKCAGCADDSLAKHGFKFTVAILTDSSSKKVLTEILPKDPKELNTFIKNWMNKLKAGNYSKATPDLISLDEERSLALFLALSENGTQKQKDFINAVLEISRRPDGKIELLDPKNPHKLWKLLAEDSEMTPEEMDGWIELLNQVAKDSKGSASKSEAFYKELEKRAGQNPELQEQYRLLKAKKCFFST